MSDWEPASRNAFNEIHPQIRILGCWFHYTHIWGCQAKIGPGDQFWLPKLVPPGQIWSPRTSFGRQNWSPLAKFGNPDQFWMPKLVRGK